MRWPDTLRPDDQRLAEVLRASDGHRPDLTVTAVLRHVPGRRITALADDGDRSFVVKLFHSPRARGNHRRLTELADAGLVDIVPTSHGCDASGHIGVVGHRPGVELQEVPDAHFVPSCRRAGVALRRLHDSGALLDRAWTADDEVTHLRSMLPGELEHLVDQVAEDAAPGAPLVPSHRDCHPRQLVVDGDRVAWIDLDDCTMAPAGLDVGNMLAHLTREHLVGRRTVGRVTEARAAFLDGYGDIDVTTRRWWEQLSLLRLAGLAETRHHAPAERDALLSELGVRSA